MTNNKNISSEQTTKELMIIFWLDPEVTSLVWKTSEDIKSLILGKATNDEECWDKYNIAA